MHLLRFIREHQFATTIIVLVIVDAFLVWLYLLQREHGFFIH